MLKEAKRLYDLGWAIHWLHPKSKRPIESKWTTGPRKKWNELKAQYRPGMNMGVRLGTPSVVAGGHLAVIDVDIKSKDPKHRKEAYEKVGKLLSGVGQVGTLSGRGNGSGHLFGATLAPGKSRRLSQSSENARVFMPSAQKPSKYEQTTLTTKEIKDGIRIRPAWEISFMGDGSQVVLPPSIHPDTKREYQWRDLDDSLLETLPVFLRMGADNGVSTDSSGREHRPLEEKTTFGVVDLLTSNLSNDLVELITEGKDCEDRSAALFSVSMKMLRKGFTKDQILSVLTDKSNFLGQAAYDHAKTTSRKRAAEWLDRFTFKKARSETSAKKDFDDIEDVEEKRLSYEEAQAQFVELVIPNGWPDLIERVEGPESKPKGSIKNVSLILENTLGATPFTRNDFSGREFYTMDTPWGGKRDKEITDGDVINIRLWLSKHYQFEPPKDKTSDAVKHLAGKNSCHPVREYLQSLEWDGIPRLDSWLKTYLGATAPEPYLSEISRKVLCAMVGRIMVPGVKFDYMLILEGKQGTKKTTATRILASSPWFCETLGDIRDKDAMLNLQGAWVVEISELSTLKRADNETYKAFFTRQVDRVRAPYGERWQENKRQCIFIGTTNSDAYLTDRTGNRRFWPVKIDRLDSDAFERDRDQLFAEAVFAWELGETLYLPPDIERQATKIQESRIVEDESDAMTDGLRDWLADNESEDPIRISDLFRDNGAFEKRRPDNWQMQKAAQALKNLGFVKFKSRTGERFWKKQ